MAFTLYSAAVVGFSLNYFMLLSIIGNHYYGFFFHILISIIYIWMNLIFLPFVAQCSRSTKITKYYVNIIFSGFSFGFGYSFHLLLCDVCVQILAFGVHHLVMVNLSYAMMRRYFLISQKFFHLDILQGKNQIYFALTFSVDFNSVVFLSLFLPIEAGAPIGNIVL